MEQKGIFIFDSGDFEGLFSDNFIGQNLSHNGEINKESIAVNSKYYAETGILETILKSDSKKQLTELYDKMVRYFNNTMPESNLEKEVTCQIDELICSD